MNKIYYKTLATLFILISTSVTVSNYLSEDKLFSEIENRNLAQKPKFSIERLLDGRYLKKYEKYKSDQFIFRDEFKNFKSTSDLLLGKKESNNVYYSFDDHLIEKFTQNDDTQKLNLDALNKFSTLFPETKIYFSIVPTAIAVLKEKLPPFVDDTKQLDTINSFYKNLNISIKTLDLVPTLSSLKNEYIYYKTDHHYTSFAAYNIYLDLKKTMNLKENITFTPLTVTNSFNGSLSSKSGFRLDIFDSIDIYIPDNSNIKLSVNYIDSNKKTTNLYDLEKLNTKDKYSVFTSGNHPIIDINTTRDDEKKLLLIKDSYGNSLLPFLAEHYSKITVIDPRYYFEDLHKLIKENEFDDILIFYNANTFFNDNSLSYVLDNK